MANLLDKLRKLLRKGKERDGFTYSSNVPEADKRIFEEAIAELLPSKE